MGCGACWQSTVSSLACAHRPWLTCVALLPTPDVKPGQGLYRSQALDGTTTWFAKNCDANSYGLKSVLYGRVVMPCRDCPAGMVTSKDAATFPNSASHFVDNGDGTGGFTDPLACVTQAGWGYSGRSTSRCARVGVWLCLWLRWCVSCSALLQAPVLWLSLCPHPRPAGVIQRTRHVHAMHAMPCGHHHGWAGRWRHGS